MRILYQVEREMAPYLSLGAGGKSRLGTVHGGRSRVADMRPQQIRVPACGDEPGRVVLRWLRFLMALLDPTTPMGVVAPIGQGWADLLVGEPAGAQCFCIRATPKALPLTSDIPYTLDAAFVESAGRLVSGPLPDGPIVVRRAGGRSPVASVSNKIPWFRSPKVLLIGGVGAGVVAAGVAGVTLLKPSSSASGGGAASAGASGNPKAAAPDDGIAGRAEKPAQAGATRQAQAPQAGPEGGAETGPWEELCNAYREWAGLFVRSLDDERRARFAADPDLRRVLGCFGVGGAATVADPWAIAGVDRGYSLASLTRTPPAGARTPEAARRVTQSLECLRAASRELSPQGWPKLAKLNIAAERFRRRGWGRAADAAAAAVAGVRTGSGVDLAAALDAALAAADRAEGVEARWTRIEGFAATMARADDAVLAGYGAWARRAATQAGEPAGADALAEVEARLREVEGIGEQLAAFVGPDGGKGGWGAIDHEAFAAGAKVHQELASGRAVDAGMLRDWLYQVRGYPSLDPALDPRRGWESIAGAMGVVVAVQPPGYAALESAVARLAERAGADEARRSRERLAELRRRTETLAGMRWSAANRGAIESQAAGLVEEVGEFRRAAERRLIALSEQAARSFAEASERLRGRGDVTGSAAVNAAWRGWRDALIAEQERQPGGGDPLELARLAEVLEVAAETLDDSVPRVQSLDGRIGVVGGGGGGWVSAVRAAAAEERERVLAAAAASVQRGEGVRAPSVVESRANAAAFQAAAAFEEYLREVAGLVREAAELERGLNAGGGAEVLERAAVVRRTAEARGGSMLAAVGPVLGRAEQLEQILTSVDRAGLAERVRMARADRPEQAIAAWRRLGSLPGRAWPANLEELAAERSLRESLQRVIGSLESAESRAAFQAELTREAPVRWERAAAGVTEPAQLEGALAQMGEWGVTGVEGIGDPSLRFNAQLAGLRAHLRQAGADEDAALGAVEAFLAQAAAGPAEVRSAAAGLLDGLREVVRTRRQAQAGGAKPRVDVAKLGPGALAGWSGAEIDGGAAVVFRRAGAAGEEIELRFHVVEVDSPGGRSAVYVQDRELTLGQFIGIIGGAGKWAEAGRLLPRFTGGDDPRLGPRVWAWAEQPEGEVAPIQPADSWLRRPASLANRPTPQNYAPGVDAGTPTPDHPMQQVPPEAALYAASLAGCRLPTSAEWRAAHAAAGSPAPGEGMNLRDATWQRQHAFVDAARKSGRNAEWPDEGIFWPADAESGRRGRAAESHSWDDGVLWLRSSASGEGVFRNLIGNVAEFVFEDAAASGALGSDPEGARQLLRARGAALAVIGGSALSPPDVPVDAPQRVDLEEAMEWGFADVGFRLAFAVSGDAVRKTAAAEAISVIASFGYLSANR